MDTTNGRQHRHGTRRHGTAMVYIIMSLSVLLGFCSVAVDLGRAQVAKTELRRVADAAARAAAYELQIGADANTIKSAASSMVTNNAVDGGTLSMNTSTDVQFLVWTNSTTYTVQASPSGANAVRVFTRRTSATGNPISLMFANTLGKSSVDMIATSIALVHTDTYAVWVPATGNPWLAGEQSGVQASVPDAAYPDPSEHWQQYDLAPAQSPASVGITLIPGATVTISGVSGNARKSPDSSYYSASGSGAAENDDAATTPSAPGYTGPGNAASASQATGSEHGMASLNVPGDSIVGVFLDANTPDGEGTPPPGLDFTSQASQDYTSISPLTRQPFYLGDGQTSSGGTQQTIVVPPDATRFYLGIMDGHEWSNNAGGYNATIKQTTITIVQ